MASDRGTVITQSARRRKPTRAKQLGVTDADYARMLAAQGGVCAIRGCKRTPKTRKFHVDHNHATLRVRALLCHWHNRILPKTADEAHALYEYLTLHEADVPTVDSPQLPQRGGG